MKKVMMICFLFLSIDAYADQLGLLTFDQAKKTYAFLKENNIKEVILWCACCKNEPAKKVILSDYYYKILKEDERFYQFYIEGKSNEGEKIETSVDLAYVHIRLNNKAVCLGMTLNFECNPCTEPFDWFADFSSGIPIMNSNNDMQDRVSVVLKKYSSVVVKVDNSVTTLRGRLPKYRPKSLMRELSQLKPRQIINQLQVKDFNFPNVELEATFPGNWANFLLENLDSKIPEVNGAQPGKYTVIVKFVIDPNGYVRDIKPLTNLGYGMAGIDTGD